MVLVSSKDMKESIATAMQGANGTHVKKAAYSIIFAADKGK